MPLPKALKIFLFGLIVISFSTSFSQENKDFDGTIVFNTPSYKVWIGNFKSRIEAERNLSEFKKRYPNALLIRPNK